MNQQKLEAFTNSREKVKLFEDCLSELESIDVLAVLEELNYIYDVNTAHPQGQQMAAAAYHESVGYMRCIETLRDLPNVLARQQEQTRAIVPDFGANETMLEEGRATEDQLKTFHDGA